VPLAERRLLTPSEIKSIVQADFDKWYTSGVGFLKGVIFYLQEKEYKIAAFMLHQAAERTYNAIILVFSGYKPRTHNLDKLKRYSKRFSVELEGVFPCNSQEEEHLFDLLKRGYIDARYKDDYVITEEELQILVGRVKLLQFSWVLRNTKQYYAFLHGTVILFVCYFFILPSPAIQISRKLIWDAVVAAVDVF
jgi:HEPN domain-containing protein